MRRPAETTMRRPAEVDAEDLLNSFEDRLRRCLRVRPFQAVAVVDWLRAEFERNDNPRDREILEGLLAFAQADPPSKTIH